METVKITEKEKTAGLLPNADFLITQNENVDGTDTYSLRRAGLGDVVTRLSGEGLVGTAALSKLNLSQDGKYSASTEFLSETAVSNNLFDKSTATTETEVYLGKKNNVEQHGWYLSTVGSAVSSVSMSGVNSTSAKIKAKPGTQYVTTEFAGFVSELDEDDNFIVAHSGQRTFTTAANTAFLRISFKASDIEFVQINEGGELSAIDDFGVALPNFQVPDYKRKREALSRSALSYDYMIDYPSQIADIANKYVTADTHNFIWVSDTHISRIKANEHIIPYVAEMSKRFPAEYIAHCGDIIDGQVPTSEALSDLSGASRLFNEAKCPAYFCKGNHDYNFLYAANHGYNSTDYIYNKDLYARTNAFCSNLNGNRGEMYFYVDDEEHKIRSIFLNIYNKDETKLSSDDKDGLGRSHGMLGAKQLQWYADTLTETPDGWGVVLFMHKGNSYGVNIITKHFADRTSGTVANTEIADIPSTAYSIDVDFRGKTSYFIARFVGDDHYDRVEDMTSSNVRFGTSLHILNASLARDNIDNASMENNILMPPEKTFGTATETAFDLVSIDTENCYIYLTRFGAVSLKQDDGGEWTVPVSRTRRINYTDGTWTEL